MILRKAIRVNTIAMDDAAGTPTHRWSILQIISSSAVSGAEKQFVLLCKMLRNRGHVVNAVCPPNGWLASELARHAIPTMTLPLRGRHYLPNLLKLLRFVRQQRVDIIHAHLTRATYYGLFLYALSRKPAVATVHILNSDPVYRWFTQRGNQLIAVSESVRQWLLQQGISPDRVSTIRNATELVNWQFDGRDMAGVVRAEFGLAPSAQLVGLFGTVSPMKGIDLLIRALPDVVKRYPECHVLSVGKFETGFAQQVQQLANHLGVSKHITFAGERYDVPRLMQAVDIVILPSRKEAFGLAALEAMALAKPVVVSCSGGLSELVQHRQNGLVVEASPQELAQALTELLGDTDLRERLGQAARHTACQYYTPQQMIQAIENLYQQVTDRKRC